MGNAIVSLPMYPELMVEQIERVATEICDFVQMDGWHYEVILRSAATVSAPTAIHQRVSRNLEFRMWDFAQKYYME